jgi:hypothetical protein
MLSFRNHAFTLIKVKSWERPTLQSQESQTMRVMQRRLSIHICFSSRDILSTVFLFYSLAWLHSNQRERYTQIYWCSLIHFWFGSTSFYFRTTLLFVCLCWLRSLLLSSVDCFSERPFLFVCQCSLCVSLSLTSLLFVASRCDSLSKLMLFPRTYVCVSGDFHSHLISLRRKASYIVSPSL